jgi:hypothetical protein
VIEIVVVLDMEVEEIAVTKVEVAMVHLPKDIMI